MSEERRAHPRISLVEQLDLEEPEKVPVTLRDISLGGVRFDCERSFPPDTAVRLTIDFYPVEFAVRCLIAWNRQLPEGRTEHGAEFVNLPPEERILIRDFLEEVHRRL